MGVCVCVCGSVWVRLCVCLCVGVSRYSKRIRYVRERGCVDACILRVWVCVCVQVHERLGVSARFQRDP